GQRAVDRTHSRDPADGDQTNPLGKGGDLMTRGNPSRAIFAALLALGLLVNFSLPAAAAPTDETGPDGSVVTQALTGVEGTHFGFGRGLNRIGAPPPGWVTNRRSPPAGFTGTPTPCTNVIGGTCTITGAGATGTYSKTGSGTITINNIALPAGPPAPAVGT